MIYSIPVMHLCGFKCCSEEIVFYCFSEIWFENFERNFFFVCGQSRKLKIILLWPICLIVFHKCIFLSLVIVCYYGIFKIKSNISFKLFYVKQWIWTITVEHLLWWKQLITDRFISSCFKIALSNLFFLLEQEFSKFR